MPENTSRKLDTSLRSTYPELEPLAAASPDPVWVVGGAVRDLLLGRDRADNVDLVVVGDPAPLIRALGAGAVEHHRFATAKAHIGDGLEVDVASARTESYPSPGALPEVAPTADLSSDLGRRDFTVNAIAVSLRDGAELDPHGGEEDLRAGLLRVLHNRSFVDDPTRALRAARYAARFGFSFDPGTERLLRATELATVSEDRRRAELRKIALEERPGEALAKLEEWGLFELAPGGAELSGRVSSLLDSPPWRDLAPRDRAVLGAAHGPSPRARELAGEQPGRPSEAVELAKSATPSELVIARAMGAEWLDRYVGEWSSVRLEIDGADLIAAGVPEGPRVGEGLAAALAAKLDGEVEGAAAELELALRAAGGKR
jgi:tRNA nucleotidyltransferase (CCA-adding enzyme)